MLSEIEDFVNWVRRRNPQARIWRDYSYDLAQFVAVVGDQSGQAGRAGAAVLALGHAHLAGGVVLAHGAEAAVLYKRQATQGL